jgi:hypothetical protein
MGTNIGLTETLTAREGSKFDEMEIDQSGSSSITKHNSNSNPVIGNESPTQTIRDGLISTPCGVSFGVFTDLKPNNGQPLNTLSGSWSLLRTSRP